MKYNKFLEDLELIDQDHKNFSIETPLRDDAFEISDDEKISIIQKNVKEILETLGMDMTDDSLRGTPKRVAKAYVKDLLENSDEGKFSIISHGRGKYGRVLGEIFVKGHEQSVNELLKENGHAYEYHGEKKKVFGS